jgi:sugar/nucleoside kinase (ribokinase family)
MCVVEDDGEIHVAAQDMEISNQFAIDTEVKRRIETCKTILLDFNLKPVRNLDSKIVLKFQKIILERICAIGRESNKTILADPTSLFRIPEREAVIRKLDFYFPNLAELIVTEMQVTKGEVDFDEAQRVESSWLAEPSKLGLNIKNCCENLRKSGVNCELLVTAAEHGVFHVEDTDVVHYPLISSVNWEKVPRGDPVHVNGCGDTFTGCFVAQLSKGELSKEEIIKAALTASQISLRSVQNISPVIDF